MTTAHRIHTVRPRVEPRTTYTGASAGQAYHYPQNATGAGATIGYIELGGGIDPAEVSRYMGSAVDVTVVLVDGGSNSSDGPSGADGEVLLDCEVGASVAPGARHRVYFAPNTDQGFRRAVAQAGKECDVVSISWGSAETNWSSDAIKRFGAVFADLRQRGVKVFAASGDSGSTDSTASNVVDYPACDPNVIGCGGTELVVDGNGERVSEVAWDINDQTSASGGGVSSVFPGRQVPDIAGNASPNTGYAVLVDGTKAVIGGTSAVAPLMAGFAALVHEATQGKAYDFLNTVVTNPQACYDVTQGDNGGYRAGPGRDNVTGFGVVDGVRFLAALTGPTPAPVPPIPVPVPPTPPTPPAGEPSGPDAVLAGAVRPWVGARHSGSNLKAAKAVQVWLDAKGV